MVDNLGYLASSLLLAILILIIFRSAALEKRLIALDRDVGAKLDALLKHAGIKLDPFVNVPQAVFDAVKDGKTILAVKRYRQATGASLFDAKELVDKIQRQEKA